MIEINLLPEEMRKKERAFKKIEVDLSGIDLAKLPVGRIAVWAAVFFVCLHLGLFLIGYAGKAWSSSLAKEYEEILPEKGKADQLKAESDLIAKKVKTVNELMSKRFSWARKLNSLSDAVTPGVWLSDLAYNERGSNEAQGNARAAVRSLTISGCVSKMSEEGTALVGRFIQNLKDNREFYSDFSAIELGSIKSDKWDDQEIMRFTITCFFR